jgi:hypothetical protein
LWLKRLGRLAVLSIKKVVAPYIDYGDLIMEFSARKLKKVQFM